MFRNKHSLIVNDPSLLQLVCHYSNTNAMHVCSLFPKREAKRVFSVQVAVHSETHRCECSLIVNDTPIMVSRHAFAVHLLHAKIQVK